MSIRLEIASIAAGGDGLAHVLHDDRRRAVFVARAAPGDVVEADVDWSRKPARGKVVRLVAPSPVRTEPPCPIAERCGGCDLMHITLAAQADAHQRIVREGLEHALGRDGAAPGDALPPIAVHAAPQGAGYRTRARLAVSTERGRVTVGYRRGASHDVENVERCWVLDPRLGALFADLRELFRGQRGRGEIGVALGRGELPVVEVRWEGELAGSFFAALDTKVTAGSWAGAEVWLEGAREPARIGAPEAITRAADGEELVVPSGSFAQAHPAMNAKLGERLVALSDLEGQSTVELFAGSGNFTVLLARHAGSLVAVESDGRAVSAARANVAARGLEARLIEADADAFDIPASARVVVLDPPRTGAPGAVRRIAASKARQVVYVSCDAPTFARDAATLASAGFHLASLETFEMFPHTSHVEVLAVLDRGPRARPGGARP